MHFKVVKASESQGKSNSVLKFLSCSQCILRSLVCLFRRKMSQQPCRQLNSAAIKGEILAHVGPIVNNKCTVIGVKCVCRVKDGESGIRSAWNHIVAKRNECDNLIRSIPGVAFFFSAISTFQQSKSVDSEDQQTSIKDEQEDSDDPPSEVSYSNFVFPNMSKLCS